MKQTITLLLALLLIFTIGLLSIPFAITAMVIVFISGFIYIVRQCKELSENRFGKKTEL